MECECQSEGTIKLVRIADGGYGGRVVMVSSVLSYQSAAYRTVLVPLLSKHDKQTTTRQQFCLKNVAIKHQEDTKHAGRVLIKKIGTIGGN